MASLRSGNIVRPLFRTSRSCSPAELVYGRGVHSPIRLFGESWESRGSDPTVVEYILTLLERLKSSRGIAETNMKVLQKKSKKVL